MHYSHHTYNIHIIPMYVYVQYTYYIYIQHIHYIYACICILCVCASPYKKLTNISTYMYIYKCVTQICNISMHRGLRAD